MPPLLRFTLSMFSATTTPRYAAAAAAVGAAARRYSVMRHAISMLCAMFAMLMASYAAALSSSALLLPYYGRRHAMLVGCLARDACRLFAMMLFRGARLCDIVYHCLILILAYFPLRHTPTMIFLLRVLRLLLAALLC